MARFLVFKVGTGNYSMNVDRVAAIETINYINTSASNGNILGIIDLRGDVVPVASLRKKFGFPETPVTEKTDILVTSVNGSRVALKIDAVREIVDDANLSEGIPEVARKASTTYVKGVIHLGNELVIVIDPDSLMTEESEVISTIVREADEKKAAEKAKQEEERRRLAEEEAKRKAASENN